MFDVNHRLLYEKGDLKTFDFIELKLHVRIMFIVLRYIFKGAVGVITESKKRAISQIDQLMNQYCEHCMIKTHIRKSQNKTQAHHFCISECSVGKQIQQLGNELQ